MLLGTEICQENKNALRGFRGCGGRYVLRGGLNSQHCEMPPATVDVSPQSCRTARPRRPSQLSDFHRPRFVRNFRTHAKLAGRQSGARVVLFVLIRVVSVDLWPTDTSPFVGDLSLRRVFLLAHTSSGTAARQLGHSRMRNIRIYLAAACDTNFPRCSFVRRRVARTGLTRFKPLTVMPQMAPMRAKRSPMKLQDYVADENPPTFDEVIGRVSEISTLPNIAMKVMEVANDPDSSVLDMKRDRDGPVVYARVLRCVNSSGYASGRRFPACNGQSAFSG